jgi:hypothetical protein
MGSDDDQTSGTHHANPSDSDARNDAVAKVVELIEESGPTPALAKP